MDVKKEMIIIAGICDPNALIFICFVCSVFTLLANARSVYLKEVSIT